MIRNSVFLYRSVCNAPGSKTSKKGELPQWDYCSQYPAQGSTLCEDHQKDLTAPVPERLDSGVMTRKQKQELGLGEEILTSGQGCRKKENVTVRKTRKETAGMLYAIRPCGVTIDSEEMIESG